jgi:hypothetical protein
MQTVLNCITFSLSALYPEAVFIMPQLPCFCAVHLKINDQPESLYAILYCMEKDLCLMNEWAGFLQRWGLTNVAISLLNGTRPLMIPISQFLIMSSSFFGPNKASLKFQKFIDLLEDDTASKEFSDYLQAGADLP